MTEAGRRFVERAGEQLEVVVVGANEVASMLVPGPEGVYVVGTGSAGVAQTSHVLAAMGLDDDQVRGAVRLSVGWSTTPDDVDRFLEVFPGVVDQVCDGLARR